MKFGMFHQLRVDERKEFYLLFTHARVISYRQSESTVVCFLVIVFIALK